jgi:nitronate monooxygenase
MCAATIAAGMKNELLSALGIEHPIVLAPMGGGPGTAALAAAVSNAGGLGSIAAAYWTPEQTTAEIAAVRARTAQPIAVNLFAGGYHTTLDRDPQPVLHLLGSIHEFLHLPPPLPPVAEADPFPAQLEAVLAAKPEVFSFTFGIPSADAMRALKERGIFTIGTATTLQEAQLLADADAGAIVAQGAEAGAHRGTFAGEFASSMVPTLELVRQIAGNVRIPVIASGGIMTGGEIARALQCGATAVQLGTAFLACPEAGTSEAYRKALLQARGEDTVITRAFSGRAARGIRNAFIDAVREREESILPFPMQNSLTRPMRAAAAKLGRSEYLSLWAGTGVARIRPMAAAELMQTLLRELQEATA